ncbi:MAG: hypothetical protein ACFFBW_08760 [Promethearchaeota archaeon]
MYRGKRILFTFALIFTSLFLSLNTNIFFSSISEKGVEIKNPLTLQSTEFVKYNASDSYLMKKFANITDSMLNVSDIEISLPSNNWNITHFGVDFKNISVNEETITIEDFAETIEILENGGNEQLAMQLKLTETTTIYSVDIKGFKIESSSSPGTIYFEIRDWDSANHEPELYTHVSVELNMSADPGWYTQSFSEPLELVAGDYGLVIDATDIESGDYVFWQINDNKTGSSLYINKFYRSMGPSMDWNAPEDEKLFLHRYNKWSNKSYYPSEINLTLNVNGMNYSVDNGAMLGEGTVSIDNIDFKLGSSIMDIPIANNKSLNLNFNLNYTINLYDQLSIDSSIEIGDLIINKWYLYPELENYSCDYYCYQFIIPENWQNIQVFKEGLNVSSDINVVFQNQTLTILGDLITEGANWEIYAENAPKSLILNLSDDEFQPAQDLEIEVESPYAGGKLGLIIQDAKGRIIHINEKMVISSYEIFNYLIRSDATDGIWKAYVYWFNSTDAGFNSINFEVNIPLIIPPPDPFLIILLICLGGAITAGGFGTYSFFKLRKTKEEQKRQNIIRKFKDLINLEYIIVTDKISSLDLFSQSFKNKTLDLTLVSAFLNAIRSFGIEITGSSEQSQVIKLEYQDSKIIMSEYKQFRLIFIMKETPSNEFLEALRLITIETDERFGRFLVNFDGDVRPFIYVERLLMKRLETRLLYPLKIIEIPNVKLNPLEKNMIMQVRKLLKSTNSTNFRVSDFIDKDAIDPLVVKLFIELMEKKFFQPIIEDNTIIRE